MDTPSNDNQNLLEAVVQNTEMGKNTLEQILPMAQEGLFRAELLRQRNIYRELNQDAHTALAAGACRPRPEHHGQAQHQNGHQHEDHDR